VITHTGETSYALSARALAVLAGMQTITITREGLGMNDVIETVPKESSETYTVSYTTTLLALGMLAGAMGGLVTALEPPEFLPATNTYLINHPWQDGFATAVHLSIDLESGAFRIWTAGHPPALHWRAGAGRWTPLESEGPMLGLIEDAEFEPSGGVLRTGDALILYTDGMVETRHADIGLGIDRLIGQAERRLRSKFEGGAKTLVESTGSRGDDRALLLVWRD